MSQLEDESCAQDTRVQVSVDPLQCGCTGYCQQLLPDVFRLLEGGTSVTVLNPNPPHHLLGELKEAETLCPTRAIRVEILNLPRA